MTAAQAQVFLVYRDECDKFGPTGHSTVAACCANLPAAEQWIMVHADKVHFYRIDPMPLVGV